MNMIRPPYLESGDTVMIVAPARKVSRFEVKPAADLLASWGLEVKYGKNLYKSQNQFAGSDTERGADVQSALNSKTAKAILFARGGYGSVRIVDRLDWKRFAKNPKWLIGFSDITVFHSHLHRHLETESLHAPLALTLPGSPPAAMNVIKDTLFGKALKYTSTRQLPGHEKLNRKGIAKGKLTGGNLSVLYSMLGSPSDIDTAGKILFLEDLDEYVYHIDRMMMNLKRNGKLEHLAGLIVGGLTEMKDHEIPFGKTAEEIILDAVSEYDFPVLFGFPSGHIPGNFPLILGRAATLKVSDNRMDLIFHS